MIALAGKRIVVTGGAGFLGGHLMRRLQTLGCRDVFVPTYTRMRSHAQRRRGAAVCGTSAGVLDSPGRGRRRNRG